MLFLLFYNMTLEIEVAIEKLKLTKQTFNQCCF